MSKLDQLIKELCPNGVEYKFLYEVTTWDKKFNGTNKYMQPNTVTFKHVSARKLKELETEDGDIKLLSTGNFDGYTTESSAKKYINKGEVVTIPSGGVANIKYYNGDFVDSGNLLAVAASDEFDLKFIWYYLLKNQHIIQGFF